MSADVIGLFAVRITIWNQTYSLTGGILRSGTNARRYFVTLRETWLHFNAPRFTALAEMKFKFQTYVPQLLRFHIIRIVVYFPAHFPSSDKSNHSSRTMRTNAPFVFQCNTARHGVSLTLITKMVSFRQNGMYTYSIQINITNMPQCANKRDNRYKHWVWKGKTCVKIMTVPWILHRT